MKSCFARIKDGFNFIEVEDFDFIQTCLDFIVNKVNDFISKLQIALKECYETEYWLELMHRAGVLSDVSSLIHNSGVIRKMLISSINTAKQNANK